MENNECNFERTKSSWQSMWIAGCILIGSFCSDWIAMRIAVRQLGQPLPLVAPSSALLFLFLSQKIIYAFTFSLLIYIERQPQGEGASRNSSGWDISFAKPQKRDAHSHISTLTLGKIQFVIQ